MALSTTFLYRERWRMWVALAVAAVLIATIGLTVHHLIKREVRRLVGNSLDTMVDTHANGMALWTSSHRELAGTIVERSVIREYARAALLGDADAQSWLSESLMSVIEPQGFASFFLLDGSGAIKQASVGPASGHMPATLRPFLDDSIHAPTITPPMMMPHHAADEALAPHIAVCAALRDPDSPPYGFLVLLIHPQDDFADFLAAGQFGKSGETYAVDSEGWMIAPSRFMQQLKSMGLLKETAEDSILRMVVRDPGRDLRGAPLTEATGGHLPLTRSVGAVTQKQPGMDLEPYRDYRGVPVVGAWRWLDDMGIGIIVEIDADEAYAPLTTLRMVFGVLVALLAIATVVGTVIWRRNNLLGRRANDAEARLRQVGQYQLEKKIGEGGMGAVYLGQHSMLRRRTAIKMIAGRASDEDLKLFEREVQLCCQLTHPNTIAVYDYGRAADGTFYYAMEFLEGADLDTVIERTGPIPPGRVIHVLTQACWSLAEAHRANLIHRDIKPANIFLSERGGVYDFVKVLDFGLAKSTDARSPQLSAADVISGTPPYMCPEIIQQSSDVDGRSDLYSLAIVGIYLLTGKVPFDGSNVMDVLMAHVQREPPSLEELAGRPVPPDLEGVLMTCLAKDPADRPRNADALRRALENCADAGTWTSDMAATWWAEEWKHETGDSGARVTSGGRTMMLDSKRFLD
ncbi:MAG: serine/threonine protein kinase [Planctomycetota bacterium]|jgi:hypothetical protein|nr:serine/threonine protein kinase [Planctomycetota bacterium]